MLHSTVLLLLLLSIYSIPTVTGATCPSHIDGVKCTRNGECPSDSRCLFGNDDPPGYGYCCQLKKHGYYNTMFSKLIDDPDSRLPADLLEPVSVKETCDNSRDCVYPEVCMVSRRFEGHQEIQSPHWTTIPDTHSVQFCNPESECSNNHCFKMSSSKLIKTKITRVWETEKVVIHHSFFKGHYSNLVPYAVLKMEEIDEINENNVIWEMEVKNMNWLSDVKKKHCAFRIRGKRLEMSPKTSIRVRQPELICNGVREDFSGDLEIFGAKLTFQTEKEQYDGLCGHRRELCPNHKFPYALPLEANAMRDPEPCNSDDDCNMFHNAIGTCVFHDSVRKVFELRDKKYLNTTMITRNSLYGMCCYTEEHGCAYGGRPLKDDLTVSNCTLQSDCNPDKPTYEWTAYCSMNEKKSSECCTVKIDRFKFSTPSEYNFLTNTPCDPTKPLERVYQWSYCDPDTEKIMILGRKAPNGKMLDEETRTCLKVWESNEPQSWAMITVLLVCILGIIIIFMCMPTPIFQ
ncbi:hypothetical protein CAEBREN_18287 [Caenorhabditis brenneri]|uniref:Domain of unknown function DX domain-containing protein n=1 Tax=Caenorhabditis brenneri TaxID=135651 RepID=G0MUN8_CAEBE|nr:hypothetical protein CAEBREN_18287 [Caenorhabditis brenneri]